MPEMMCLRVCGGHGPPNVYREVAVFGFSKYRTIFSVELSRRFHTETTIGKRLTCFALRLATDNTEIFRTKNPLFMTFFKECVHCSECVIHVYNKS